MCVFSRARSLHKITAPIEPSKIPASQEQDKMDMADKQCSTPTVTRARKQVSTDFSSPQQTGHNSEPDSRASKWVWFLVLIGRRRVECGVCFNVCVVVCVLGHLLCVRSVMLCRMIPYWRPTLCSDAQQSQIPLFCC